MHFNLVLIALKTKKNHNGQSKRGKYGKGHGQEEFKVKLRKFPEARENAREQVAIRGLSDWSIKRVTRVVWS